MNKSAALERLTKLETEAAELRKIIEQPEEVGLWEPQYGGVYSLIQAYGVVDSTVRNNSFDEDRMNFGNCFQTEAIARKASELQRKFNHVMRAAFQADPDAGEWSEERKFSPYFEGGRWRLCQYTSGTEKPCVHTRDQAIKACRLLNAWQAKEDAKS